MPPEPTAPQPPQPPPQAPEGSHAERLLRAQAAELQALRDQVKDLPDPDTLAAWRASHERLTALQNDLPQWRQELQAAHQAERARLEGTVQEQAQALQQAQLEAELQRSYLQSGGIPAHFPAWMELSGKGISRGEDGTLQLNGHPLGEALAQQREDALFGAFYHARMGAGSGAHSSRDGRVSNVRDLQKMPTSQLFREGFARRSAGAGQ